VPEEPEPGVEDRTASSPESDAPKATSRRGIVVTTAVLVVAIVTTLSIVLAGGPAIPGAGMTPTAFVISATQTTIAHHTADLVISGSVTASGTTVPLRGTGQADLTAGAFAANVTTSGAGLSLVEHELVIDGHFYLGITSDGQDVSSIVPGKDWIQIPIPATGRTSTLGTGTVDPIDQLQLLARRGNAVRPLGTSVIDGVTVSGFAVTMSKKAMAQNLQKELGSAQLSPAARQAIRTSSSSISAFTMDVWFDASGLMRRMSADVDTSASTANLIMTFDNYGAPVNISAPAPGDVVSYSDFATAVQSEQAKAQAAQK